MSAVRTHSTSARTDCQSRIFTTPYYEALHLHNLGYWVVPLQRGSKHRLPGFRTIGFERLTPVKIESEWRYSTEPLYPNVGIMTGIGGLVVRDFDKPAAYNQWYAQNKEIARHLPLVKTKRGVHVYARLETVPDRKKITCFGGELICHDIVVAPPSYIEEHDFSYTWIRSAIELSQLPIVLPEQLHVDLGVSFPPETTVNTKTTETTVRCLGLEDGHFGAATLREIDGAISRHRVDGPGETNRVRFALARELRRIVRDSQTLPSLAQVGDWASRWFGKNSSRMGTPDWSEVFGKFVHAYETVKYASGEDVRSAAVERVDQLGASHLDHPLLARCDDRIHILAGVMRAMGDLSAGGEFFLSTRDAARACGYVSDTASPKKLNTASRRMSDWLRLLEAAGFIRCVQRGTPGDHTLASTFVWLGDARRA